MQEGGSCLCQEAGQRGNVGKTLPHGFYRRGAGQFQQAVSGCPVAGQGTVASYVRIFWDPVTRSRVGCGWLFFLAAPWMSHSSGVSNAPGAIVLLMVLSPKRAELEVGILHPQGPGPG
jgi:hypothetical protein